MEQIAITITSGQLSDRGLSVSGRIAGSHFTTQNIHVWVHGLRELSDIIHGLMAFMFFQPGIGLEVMR
jgi:hypothetical protein